MSVTSTWQVTGMTCQHCVASVTEEVSALPGVIEVQVALEPGTVTVTSEQPLGRDAVATAITEAGYALAEPA